MSHMRRTDCPLIIKKSKFPSYIQWQGIWRRAIRRWGARGRCVGVCSWCPSLAGWSPRRWQAGHQSPGWPKAAEQGSELRGSPELQWGIYCTHRRHGVRQWDWVIRGNTDCVCVFFMRPASLPDNFAHIWRDEVSDELFHVVINGSAFLNCGYDGSEVVVSQHHLWGGFGHSCARAHGDADLCLLQSRGVVDSIASLRRGWKSYLSLLQTKQEMHSLKGSHKRLFFLPWLWSHHRTAGTLQS